MDSNSTEGDYILREQRPAESLVPALDGSLDLSERQKKFLSKAIRHLDTNAAVDVEADVAKRVMDVRNKACQIYPYPCFRAFHHVSLLMSENDAFLHILRTGQGAEQGNAPLILDIGCCMGTDLRYLSFTGYPSTSMIGCDLRQGFIDFGHELYADRDTCPIPFLVADVFDITLGQFPHQADDVYPPLKEVKSLNELRGRVKYVYAGALFHLFDQGTQEAMARRLLTLIDVTEENGPAILFGRHSALPEEGVIDDALGRIRYAHSPASWERLWKRIVGEKIPVRVDAAFSPRITQANIMGAMKGGSRRTQMMWWSVWLG